MAMTPLERSLRSVIALNSGDPDGGWTTLNQVLSLINSPEMEASDLHIGLTPARLVDSVENLLLELLIDGYIETKEDRPIFETELRLAKGGLVAPISVDSRSWTGLTETIIDPRNAKVISELIDRALEAVANTEVRNFESMQAAAYLKAAKELVDAPEPPSQLIWQMIGRAADVVGLLTLFYAIFVQAAR